MPPLTPSFPQAFNPRLGFVWCFFFVVFFNTFIVESRGKKASNFRRIKTHSHLFSGN